MTEEMGGIGAVLEEELALVRRSATSARSVVLVEGESDRRALGIVASRLGRDLVSEGVLTVAIAGATNIGRFLDLLPVDTPVSGLYDQAEEGILRNALLASHLAPMLTGPSLELAGFYMCSRDLEDELIRAVGVEGVLEVIDEEGDHNSWRRFSNQPAQRERPLEARMHRFLGTRSGRKIEYAGLLAGRIDLHDHGSPLVRILAHPNRSRREASCLSRDARMPLPD